MRRQIGKVNRRELLKLFGMTVGASLTGAALPRKISAQSSKVNILGTARNVIVIQNCGAMSPQEGLDFKQTKYTAKDLEPQQVHSDLILSKTLFPNYQVWAPQVS